LTYNGISIGVKKIWEKELPLNRVVKGHIPSAEDAVNMRFILGKKDVQHVVSEKLRR